MFFSNPRLYFSIAAVLSLFLFFSLFHGHYNDVTAFHKPATKIPGSQLDSTSMKSLSKNIHELYKPIVLPVSAPEFYDEATGETHYIDEPIWKKGFGKDLCIADIDTRGFDHDGQLMSDSFSWTDADSLSAGMMNHFLYASIHGYKYHFIHTEPWKDEERDNVWTKVPQLRKLLDECRFVVVVDADVIFQHLDLPFEWLLNRWNFTTDTSMAMPWDTAFYVNKNGEQEGEVPGMRDHKGLLSINAGVVIAQSLPRTLEMVDAWIACPDEDDLRFPGCSRFAHGWPAEQGAFANHIRYYFDKSTDLVSVPCDDANGYPELGMDCTGTFLRHYTLSKETVKEDAGQLLLQSFSSVFASHRNERSQLG